MVSTIQSDISGKQISSKESYKVSIFNRSTGTHIDMDMSHEEVTKEKILDAVKLALKNNIKWYKLSKKSDGSGWERKETETE